MYLEISSTPMKDGSTGYHAGRLDGIGRFGYTIYGEPTLEGLLAKLDAQGHKYSIPDYLQIKRGYESCQAG